jgi:hypothetical protein
MATAQPTERHEEIQFRQLLEEAVTKPGSMLRAYSLFWNYSLGNQLLALFQAHKRGISLGPIASFNRWKELGRHVKRGEKAIELCMPVTVRRTVTEKSTDGTDTETEIAFKRFVYKRNWFMLSQTDGAEYQIPAIPAWHRARALQALNVEEMPFEMLNGNCQGYAKGRQIALNPLAQLPAKTTFHELAHIELGHTSEAVHDSETLPRKATMEGQVCNGFYCCRGWPHIYVGRQTA